jgi:HNH endonuclease
MAGTIRRRGESLYPGKETPTMDSVPARKPKRCRPLVERFWPKVDASAGPDGCWRWLASKNTHGYGQIGMHTPGQGSKTIRASTAAWILLRGPIPDGLWVLHNCPDGDNPGCCNPAHLWLGTPRKNTRDMVRKRRHAAMRRRHILSDAQAAALRADRDAGLTYLELAHRYKCSYSSARKIALHLYLSY